MNMPANMAEMKQNIHESIAIANKALGGMDLEVARSVACALNLHLFRNMANIFATVRPNVLVEAVAIHSKNCDDQAFRLAALWLAMEEQAGASFESFIGAGDLREKMLAKNEATLRDLGYSEAEFR
jgi:hypothetical protein